MGWLTLDLERIAALQGDNLALAWVEAFATPMPEVASSLLRRALAYQRQERKFGGLSLVVRKQLDSVSADLARIIVTKERNKVRNPRPPFQHRLGASRASGRVSLKQGRQADAGLSKPQRLSVFGQGIIAGLHQGNRCAQFLNLCVSLLDQVNRSGFFRLEHRRA